LHLEIALAKHQPDQFQKHLTFLSDYVQRGIFRRRWTVLLVTDMAMLICFGVLFPPLAVVLAVSVIKDVMNVRLSLGKYCSIMEGVEDERVKKQMMELKVVLDREILRAGEGMWSGIWYGLLITTWIWAFVVFDTLASSVGVKEGMWILVAMACCPWIFCGCVRVVFFIVGSRKLGQSTNRLEFREDAISMIGISNPMSPSSETENQ
jgi:uncharacterized membrane protein YqaE (UPF0057 family)